MPLAIVSGALAAKPWRGGAAWVRLSYVLGLRRLGWEVFFVEELPPHALADRAGCPAGLDDSDNLRFFRSVMDAFGLARHSALLCDGRTWGLTAAEGEEAAAAADLLVNVGGNLRLAAVQRRPRRKVYVDLDPGYTQAWLAAGIGDLGVKGHDAYFTTGANVGRPGCPIPDAGIAWRHTVPPVVLDEWPADPGPGFGRFTTVGAWRGPYGLVDIGEQTLGPKAHEFRRFAALPRGAPGRFEVALDIDDADRTDRDLLRRNGWALPDPRTVAGDPEAFAAYVRGSGAECSVAQSVYVRTGSGWVSDRTTRYLASGRPALVQDTGLGRTVPTGEGLLTFRTIEEAVTGAESIAADYERHAKAARMLAEEAFDSDLVLTRMLEETGV
jgi:hypothetical protein